MKNFGVGCAVIAIVLLFLIKIVKYSYSQNPSGFKVVVYSICVIIVLSLYFKWRKKVKEKKEEQRQSQLELKEAILTAKSIAVEAQALCKKISSALNISELLLIQEDILSVNPKYRFHNSSLMRYSAKSMYYSDSMRIYSNLCQLYIKKYIHLLYPMMEVIVDINTLISFYQRYIENVPEFMNIAEKRLLNVLFSKFETIPIESVILPNDIVAKGRPCYLKAEINEILVRVRNGTLEYLEDGEYEVTIYVFDKSVEVFSKMKHYALPLLNILDLQLEDGTLILHLRGNGGHKCFEGELVPIIYGLIKKLQAKILS